MIISSINYSENIGKANEWHLKGVSFGKLNLIVGKNAVGKTRAVSVINSLARMTSGKIPRLLNGNWDVVFKHHNSLFQYILKIEEAKVIEERLSENGKVLLKRSGDKGEYYVERVGNKKYYPPEDKLTNQVRRDKRELPYLEKLIGWAEKYHSFSFSNLRPNYMLARLPTPTGLAGPDLIAEDLSMTPYLLEEIQGNTEIIRRVTRDLAYMGYKVTDLKAIIPSIPNFPIDMRIIQIIEKGIEFPIDQMALSQGMYRAIAIMVVINHLMQRGVEGTIVIDDIGEGIDFERSSKLTELIFKRAKNTGIQLIVTSNDRFLMNAVDIKHWNVFERRGKTVQAFNYGNSKKVFDEFALTGLNNFDFFADRLYRVKIHD
jgi:predicted ATPase